MLLLVFHRQSLKLKGRGLYDDPTLWDLVNLSSLEGTEPRLVMPTPL
jgi:hypothetical protein